MEEKKFVAGKLLRYGYTTGSCAAGAAKAATQMLLSRQKVEQVPLLTPKGILLQLSVCQIRQLPEQVSCAIQKDGGDDPDATHGLLIFATVTKTPQAITIDGGQGVGRVTKPGLDQPVGNAAINHVPRQMITAAVEEVCQSFGYTGGIHVQIEVPEGEQVATRTFNPHLGIQGGISILGTSGIVEPMSDQALIDTIRVECNVLRQSGQKDLLITIGNYGDQFAGQMLHLDLQHRLKCSNFIGEALRAAISVGFERAVLVGHIGKMVKLGAGIMNTHSAQGDARMDIMATCALQAGASNALLLRLLDCATTDAALDELEKENLLPRTMEILAERIEGHLSRRFGGHLKMAAVVFSNRPDRNCVLCTCGPAEQWMKQWRIADDN